MEIFGNISIFLPTIMGISLALTLFIEVLLAIILKVRSFKNIFNIILANLITNPFIVSVTYYVGLMYDEYIKYIVLIALELLAIFIEGTIIKKYVKYDRLNPYLLSVVLNVSSFVIVDIINLFIY